MPAGSQTLDQNITTSPHHHINPDFSGWEEKEKFVDFALVSVEEAAVHFDGLSFVRESADTLRIYLLLRDKSGQVREEVFRMRRVS